MTFAKPVLPLDAATSDVVDAVAAWNDYLAGDGAWTPSAAAAHAVFAADLGAPWSPTRAATAEEMRALRVLGRVVDIWRAHPWFFTRRRLSAPLTRAGAAVRYFRDALGMAVHADIDGAAPRLMRATAPAPFSTIRRHVERVGVRAIPPHGGVPACERRAQPPGFAVKGNADSGKYHDALSRWYASTAPEFWFADQAAAARAGFTPAAG